MSQKELIHPKRSVLLVEFLNIIFLLGILFGTISGIEKTWTIFRKPLLNIVVHIFKNNINLNILIIAVLFMAYISLILLFRSIIKRSSWASYAASCIIVLPPFLYLGYRINSLYLPGFLELKSVVGNFVLGIAFLIIWVISLRILYPWTKSRLIDRSLFKLRVVSRLNIFALLLGILVILNMYPLLDSSKKNEPLNIIVILVDALRADHLGCYGYHRPTSPNIDRFAQNAVIFSQAISQSSFTKTSIASLFTGEYPYNHQVYWGNREDTENTITSDVLSQEEETLAELLLQNGFITSAWVHNHHLKPYMGFGQGFTQYNYLEYSIEWMNKKILPWLNEYGIHFNSFSYIHYIDLHDPYRPKPPYDTLYGKYSDFYSKIDFEQWGSYLHKIREKQITLEKKEIEQLIAYYDGLINYVDNEIGRLFEELKRMGIYDRSLIILTADHGDAFMEHDFISHSTIPYDELLRVPLIVKFPHSRYAGKVIEEQVRLVDIKPTIIDLLNLESTKESDGFSLLYFLDPRYTDGREVTFPKVAISEIAEKDTYPIISIRTDSLKYLHFQNKEDEMYNLKLDPSEQINLIDIEKQQAQNFKRIAMEIVEHRGNNKDRRKIVLDKESIEKLKALGYIK